MGGLFSLDGKFVRFGNKLTDLMWLNILTMICCIPIITIGPALTAMHYIVLRIYRDEESYITRGFFKAFKDNFKQATLIWLIFLAGIILLGLDFWLIFKGQLHIHKFFKYGLYTVSILGVVGLSWVFVLQSRYENKFNITIKNSFIVGIANLFYSAMMFIMSLLPLIIIALIGDHMIPVVLLLGLTVPALLQAILYSRVFDRLEGVNKKEKEQESDEWTVELEEGENVQVDEETQE